jgi:hypothetical protein
LKSLPKTLDETYERILLAIDDEIRDVAIEALRWLCFAEKVLTIQELAEAAVFSAKVQAPANETPLEVSFDASERIQDPLDILGILSGLVVVYRPHDEAHDEDDEDDDEDYNLLAVERNPISNNDLRPPLEPASQISKVLLSHFSVKEYLVSGRLRCQVERFTIHEPRAHEILATSCLYYIMYCQQSFGLVVLSRNSTCEFRCDEFSPLFPYAKENWVKHARKVEYQSNLTHLIVFLLQAELPLKGCLLLYADEDDQSISQTLTPLYLASYLGLYWPCKNLVETGVDVSVEGGYYGNSLQAASFSGSESIVQLLLNHGADVNAQGGVFGSALQAASGQRSESIVQLLLRNGANLPEGEDLRRAFKSALQIGNKSILQLLISHGTGFEIQKVFEEEVSRKDTRLAIALLEQGMVLAKYNGGAEAEEALAGKDFKRFVDIQIRCFEDTLFGE